MKMHENSQPAEFTFDFDFLSGLAVLVGAMVIDFYS